MRVSYACPSYVQACQRTAQRIQLEEHAHKAVALAAATAAAATAATAVTAATAATAATINEDESKTANIHVEPIMKLGQGPETDAGLLGDIEFLNGWMDPDPGAVGDVVGDGAPATASLQGNLKPGLLKGRWTSLEDELLIQTINRRRSGSTIRVEPGLEGAGVLNAVGFHANDYWPAIAECLTGRSTKQCRERWTHVLDPSLKKTKWTIKEDAALRQAHAEIGSRWTAIAKLIPGRTCLHVRDRWRALIKCDMQNTVVLDV
jgi:hypothetical protein